MAVQRTKESPLYTRGPSLFHKLIYRLAQVVDGTIVTGGHRVHHTMVDMILQDYLAGIIQRGTDCSQLNQHLGAVIALLHHPLDLLQVTDGTGQAVDHRFLIFVNVAVGMGNAMGVHIGVIVDLFFHCSASFRVFFIIPYFRASCNPRQGMCFQNGSDRWGIYCLRGDFMAIVQTGMPTTAAENQRVIEELVATYPFCRTELLARTVFQRPISTLVIGTGPRKALFTASHHANEWITTPVLLKFAEEFAAAIQNGEKIYDRDAGELARQVTIYMVPMVDPDGVDLVTGAIPPGSVQYNWTENLADNYPNIPFPDGWKANLLGVDLNLQYPAGWDRAREIKFAQGFTRPGPRDYVGRAPLNQAESRALADYTRFIDPALVLAFHSQGREIYWQFGDIFVPGAEELGRKMAEASGYTLADVPYQSGFAGYKDWFIQVFRRPGYTIEVGKGVNPLPIEQFDEIYRDNLPILVIAAAGE